MMVLLMNLEAAFLAFAFALASSESAVNLYLLQDSLLVLDLEFLPLVLPFLLDCLSTVSAKYQKDFRYLYLVDFERGFSCKQIVRESFPILP